MATLLVEPVRSALYGLVSLLFLISCLFVVTILDIIIAIPLAVVLYLAWVVGVSMAFLAIDGRLVGHADGRSRCSSVPVATAR